MKKISNYVKNIAPVIVIILISVPTFWRMFKFGIYSMQDFHLFRLVEFDKCTKLLHIPCRWSSDAGLGFGEPLFNFYGQFVYALGELVHLMGVSFIDTTKVLFAVSLVGSAVAMYFLSKRIWNNNYAAIISSILYTYAPYRAVDVWVRGALPEAFSFILFPLILLSIFNNSYLLFSVLVAVLITTHNLSFVMFFPIIAVFIVYKSWKNGRWAIFWRFILGLILSLLLSSFYILPVIFESKYVTIENTIKGYFDYRAHFVTLKQLFISNYWGYGGSTWGNSDGLSLSIGYLQWIVPFVGLLILFLKKEFEKLKLVISFLLLGLIYLFLTHNKSTVVWNLISPMAFIQFPWRFLGVAVFCLSLASGAVALTSNKKIGLIVTSIIIVFVLILNTAKFKEDIWYEVGDDYFLSGNEWDIQRTASIGDFWPKFGHEIPKDPSDGKYINYFPGWNKEPNEDGLIEANGAEFNDTPIRKVGNILSLVSIVGVVILSTAKWKRKH